MDLLIFVTYLIKIELIWHLKRLSVSWASSIHSSVCWRMESFRGYSEGTEDDRKCWPIALIQREEHDGTRRYYIEEEDVRIVSGVVEKDGTFIASAEKEVLSFPRADFGDAAELYFICCGTSGRGSGSFRRIGSFLDAVNIYDLESKTEDRTDFSVAFWSVDAR